MDINEFNGILIEKIINSLGPKQSDLHFLHGTKVESISTGSSPYLG